MSRARSGAGSISRTVLSNRRADVLVRDDAATGMTRPSRTALCSASRSSSYDNSFPSSSA